MYRNGNEHKHFEGFLVAFPNTLRLIYLGVDFPESTWQSYPRGGVNNLFQSLAWIQCFCAEYRIKLDLFYDKQFRFMEHDEHIKERPWIPFEIKFWEENPLQNGGKNFFPRNLSFLTENTTTWNKVQARRRNNRITKAEITKEQMNC